MIVAREMWMLERAVLDHAHQAIAAEVPAHTKCAHMEPIKKHILVDVSRHDMPWGNSRRRRRHLHGHACVDDSSLPPGSIQAEVPIGQKTAGRSSLARISAEALVADVLC